jgi:ATP phosphoribosyltransferase regulatory subunit
MDRNTPRKFATTPGTRDVLPPESTRLLDVQGRIRDRFELFGFREVLTPALEYSEVIEEQGLRDVSYKLFDQDNQMLLLRPEMTTPIARPALLMSVSSIIVAVNAVLLKGVEDDLEAPA